MKPGFQTTEFWLTLVTVILGLVKQFWLTDIPNESFYTVIAYILSRTVTKVKPAGAQQ